MKKAVCFAAGGAALWIACGVAAGGFFNAASLHDHCGDDFSPAFREIAHSQVALGTFGGPVSLIMVLVSTNFGEDGWTLKRNCPSP